MTNTITQEIDIENDLLDFFNPFVYMAVQTGKTLGGFDIREVNGTHLRFIIFDKRWDDENKTILWDMYFALEDYANIMQFKSKVAPEIERSIKIRFEYGDSLLTEEQMRSHSIAMIGEQILKSNKEQGCKG